MTRRDRLRRVCILCVYFNRNFGYIRGAAGIQEKWQNPFVREFSVFCITAYNNSFDLCVLEWCKLYGDAVNARNISQHDWRSVVTEPKKFEKCLLDHLGIDAESFDAYRIKMRSYRDKFISHLDSDLRADVPLLDLAWRSVLFYYDYLVQNETKPGDLTGLPANGTILRLACEEEHIPIARKAYAKLVNVEHQNDWPATGSPAGCR